MRAYVATTATIFLLLVIAHVARIYAEGRGVLNAAFIVFTGVSALLAIWGWKLFWGSSPKRAA